MLFGQRGLLVQLRRLGKSRRPDRIRGLVRALQIAGVPDRLARQDLSDSFEHHAVTGVAADILLTVDAAAVFADRRVPPPPPSRRDHAIGHRMLQDEWLVGIGHSENPSIVFAPLYARADIASSDFILKLS